MAHLPSRKAAAILGLHPNTLRSYANRGKIPHYRNAAGQRLYDVDSYLQGNQENNQEAETVCYCRVSSHQQKDDLQRQVQFMQERFPDANIVTDVGGGLNFQRKGLVSLLERLHRGDKLRIVVAHRDRLARFGFELIQWMAEQNGGEILVLDNTDHSPRAGTHRGYSRHPPDLQLPAPRTPPLPKPNREGYDSIPQRSRGPTLKLWFDAARWCYNETVAHLRKPGTVANWKSIKTEIIHSAPERLRAAPYQVKSIAVRDACRAVTRCKTGQPGAGQGQGTRRTAG